MASTRCAFSRIARSVRPHGDTVIAHSSSSAMKLTPSTNHRPCRGSASVGGIIGPKTPLSPVSFAHWARMVETAGTFYPPDVIKAWEKGETIPSLVGPVHYRPQDHQAVRPVVIVRGKKPADMKNKEDFWEIVEILPGEGLMQ